MFKRIVNYFFYVLLFFLIFSKNSYAYLDPFTGGLLIKFFIFVFSGILIFFKKIKKGFTYIYKKISNEDRKTK